MRRRWWKIVGRWWENDSTYKYTHVNSHSLRKNMFEKWQESHIVITRLTAVIWAFLISTSYRPKCVYSTHTHTHARAASTSKWQTHKITLTQTEQWITAGELQNLSRFNKTNCLFSSNEAPTAALINTNTEMMDTRPAWGNISITTPRCCVLMGAETTQTEDYRF